MPLPQPWSPFTWVDAPWGPVLSCEALAPWAVHAFTGRGLDLPHADTGTGWAALATFLDVAADHVWRVRQVHGVTAHTDLAACSGNWPEGDLLATDRADVGLAVRTADCVPLLYADRRTGAVAAVHAGWRGTAAGAAARMVEVLGRRFGTRPGDLVVAIGPSVGPDVYEVSRDVIEAFAHGPARPTGGRAWWTARETPGKYLLDLWTITRDQLTAAGVSSNDVHLAGLCTVAHSDVLHSYRVDGAAAGRMVAAIRRAR